ncbi:hypothetical protein GLAREA_05496 [Glarea lozoyensis ATCC 20868]|uniref:Uncharacterized protein n=1 Tax=Glarea lozoyensis (strain ATCC 20868 / MF5171) TaxID=1116229 RepID=S3ECZ3_GLAL2|nr:uncharacterized protein GLAREA_05496 [Glarea lozoyensis ATCC 20868]EPE36158.1 hypothetical protein GLAREA_05496 [Glarea lozoyensis ATCC 20868]
MSSSITTPLRRALGPLDVNSAITPTTSLNMAKSTYTSLSTKPARQTEEVSTLKGVSPLETQSTIPTQTPWGGKRAHDLLESTRDMSQEAKKHKGSHGGALRYENDDQLERLDTYQQYDGRLSRDVFDGNIRDDQDVISRSPSAAASPISLYGSSQGEFDNTQQTNFTEPDHSPTTGAAVLTVPNNSSRRTPTKEEAREKIQKMRLRLQLAAYKVQTNQIDVPMSRLEVRSTPSSPHANRPMQVPQPITSITTAPRQLQTSRPISEAQPSVPSSSPPEYETDPQTIHSPRKENTIPREGYNTPVLPRQRQSMLNPPNLGSPSAEFDLTSSAVKGNAARDLLMLREVS